MLRLALAYLFRRPVQVLSVLGVTVGLLALLVVLSVMNGLIEMDRAGVRGPLSDLLLIPAVTEQPPEWEPYRAALEGVAEVEAVSPHLVAYAVLGLRGGQIAMTQTSSPDINGVQLVGIDAETEGLVNEFWNSLERAQRYTVADPKQPFEMDLGEDGLFARPGVLVSDRLANSFGIRKFERIHLAVLPPRLPDGDQPIEPQWGKFMVAGTFASSDYDVDMDRIYLRRIGIDSLWFDLLGEEAGEFNEAMIKVKPGVSLEAARSAIMAGLEAADLPLPGGTRGGALQSWEERKAVYLTAIENERRVTGLVLFFIVIVAGFGLFATISALVREKVRDLGVLAALGFTPVRRGLLLMIVGAFGSLLGSLIGCGLAWWIVREKDLVYGFLNEQLGIEIFQPGLYVIEGLPATWIPAQALFLSVAAFLTGCLFTLIPAIRAASLSPSTALRYE